MELFVYCSGGSWPTDSVQLGAREVTVRSRRCTRKIEERDKETESGSCRVNVAVCWAAPEERILHQLQLRPKGLMDRTTQQGSRVRRPLSARANWSLRPEFTPTLLWRNTYTCMDLLRQESSIKIPDQGGLRWASVVTISTLHRTFSPVPPTVTVWLKIDVAFDLFYSVLFASLAFTFTFYLRDTNGEINSDEIG